MITSARMWRDNHKLEFEREVENWEKRTARQFLYIFGSKVPSTTNPSSVRFPYPSEWCMDTSNRLLTYSNSNTTVERVGI
jgi:hypothetical protein